MKNSLRQAFINSIKTDDDLDELWQNYKRKFIGIYIPQ
jgi:hypothetical protein